MSTVILNAENKSDLDLLLQFAKRLGIKVKVLSKSEMEDNFLGLMMKEEKTGYNVSRESVMKKLSEK